MCSSPSSLPVCLFSSSSLYPSSFSKLLEEESSKSYFYKLENFLADECENKRNYLPIKANIFRCFELTPLEDVKVVILGQDPYHTSPSHATGLAFGVSKGVRPLPPSLKNIFRELKNDVVNFTTDETLESWARQGVLLLNSILTVEERSPGSHREKGWETFTDRIIEFVSTSSALPVVFIFWGNYAKSKRHLVNTEKHAIIESSHPSPYSASYGFFGSRPFSRTNFFLGKDRKIEW